MQHFSLTDEEGLRGRNVQFSMDIIILSDLFKSLSIQLDTTISAALARYITDPVVKSALV